MWVGVWAVQHKTNYRVLLCDIEHNIGFLKVFSIFMQVVYAEVGYMSMTKTLNAKHIIQRDIYLRCVTPNDCTLRVTRVRRLDCSFVTAISLLIVTLGLQLL